MTEQAPSQPVESAARGARKVLRGTVESVKMAKTIVVRVERISRHPLYKKTLRERRKFYAHDEAGAAKTGDVVEIVGTRPLSKLKRWRLVRILESA